MVIPSEYFPGNPYGSDKVQNALAKNRFRERVVRGDAGKQSGNHTVRPIHRHGRA
jgi:hypothetical protein